MGSFKDRMNRMTVTGTSQQGAVKVTFSKATGFQFTIAPKAIEALDADQMSHEATTAFSRALEGMRKGIGIARNGEPPPKTLPVRRSTDPPLTPREEFAYAVAGIDVTGSSAGGLVKVNWHSEWDATVMVKSAAMNRFDAQELADALHQASQQAMQARGNALTPLIKQTFQARMNRRPGHGDRG